MKKYLKISLKKPLNHKSTPINYYVPLDGIGEIMYSRPGLSFVYPGAFLQVNDVLAAADLYDGGSVSLISEDEIHKVGQMATRW